ncbi:MAG: hypothetical protein ACLTG0_10825 [Oscillibacter sp.]
MALISGNGISGRENRIPFQCQCKRSQSLVSTATTMSELSTELENVLQNFQQEFGMVKQETGTIEKLQIRRTCWP